MFGKIVCMIACAIFGAVCTWSWYEYSDDHLARSLVWVWELLCLASVIAIFFGK